MIRLSLRTGTRTEFVDLTGRLQDAIRQNGWRDGLLHVFSPHTTAGVTVNEGADPSVQRDILATLARLVPHRGDYQHGEGNSDAHIKASLLGSGVWVPVERGAVALGTWQAVFFGEFDGPRSRTVWLHFMATK
jgi:secondary thiamine-phosphate synthase enzyme